MPVARVQIPYGVLYVPLLKTRLSSGISALQPLFPDAELDRVAWNYEPMDPWRLAFTTGLRPLRTEREGKVVFDDGVPVGVDAAEIRAKVAEAAERLFARLDSMP